MGGRVARHDHGVRRLLLVVRVHHIEERVDAFLVERTPPDLVDDGTRWLDTGCVLWLKITEPRVTVMQMAPFPRPLLYLGLIEIGLCYGCRLREFRHRFDLISGMTLYCVVGCSACEC